MADHNNKHRLRNVLSMLSAALGVVALLQKRNPQLLNDLKRRLRQLRRR